MKPDSSETHTPLSEDRLVQRVRASLEQDSTLSAKEAARLAAARRRAFASGDTVSLRMSVYGYAAVAASVVLVAGLLLLGPGDVEPLPAQLAQLDELELLLVLEEGDPAADPEFLAWALEERG